jgi:hypothetical protein
MIARPRRVAGGGDESKGSHQHRPDGEREEGRRARRHVLVSVLQLDDEARDSAAGRRAKDRQCAEELAERADRLDADDERDAYQADYEPQGLDAVYLDAAVEERGEEEEHARETRGYGELAGRDQDGRRGDRERPEQDRLQGTAHYVPDGLSRPPTFDEDYHQETKRTDCGLEERNLSTHALISM